MNNYADFIDVDRRQRCGRRLRENDGTLIVGTGAWALIPSVEIGAGPGGTAGHVRRISSNTVTKAVAPSLPQLSAMQPSPQPARTIVPPMPAAPTNVHITAAVGARTSRRSSSPGLPTI